jgi:DNA-binding NarL/FixJ family response regulator
MPLRILVAAEYEQRRRNLETLLERDANEIACPAADGPGVVELARAIQPEVAVLDLGLGQEETLALADEIRWASRRTRVIVVQDDPSERDVVAVFRAGIGGLVLRASVDEDLARAVREVVRGELFLSPCASHILVQGYLAPARSAGPSLVGGPPQRRTTS